MDELNSQINDKNFWDNPQLAQKVSIEASAIEKLISSLSDLEKDITEFDELVKLTKEEDIDEDEYSTELKGIENKIEEIENEALYFGEYDDLNAVITINAAGGVDAHDWAEMLLGCIQDFYLMKTCNIKSKKFLKVKKLE